MKSMLKRMVISYAVGGGLGIAFGIFYLKETTEKIVMLTAIIIGLMILTELIFAGISKLCDKRSEESS